MHVIYLVYLLTLNSFVRILDYENIQQEILQRLFGGTQPKCSNVFWSSASFTYVVYSK